MLDDFGEKYVSKKHSDHLINALKNKYKVSEEWTGRLYCVIDLGWYYVACTPNIDMPGYIKTQLQR